MTPLGLTAYRWLTAAAGPLLPLVLKRRLRAGKEHAGRWRERLGRTPAERPPGALIWLHGASVGEGLSLLPLIEALRAARPEATVLLTTGTVTSAELLARRLPSGAIHQFAPLDTPAIAERFLDHWSPQVAVFTESEVWPNLLYTARRRGAATALISARLSQKSLAHWARTPSSARVLFGGFDVVMAQDDATAHALARLGARDDGRLNLKLCAAKLPSDPARTTAIEAALGQAPVLLATSTHPGEDEIVLDAFAALRRPDAILLIVPRHPERGEAVAALARARGFAAGRRGAGDALEGRSPVYVADTLGELGTWLALLNTRAALIGGSLLPGPGGHNPLEAARFGVPILSGPHVQNWAQVYEKLGDTVITVRGTEDLTAAFDTVLQRPTEARARAGRAAAIAEGLTSDLGAVARRLLALAERRA